MLKDFLIWYKWSAAIIIRVFEGEVQAKRSRWGSDTHEVGRASAAAGARGAIYRAAEAPYKARADRMCINISIDRRAR